MPNSDSVRLLIRLACFLPLAGALLLMDWVAAQPPVRHLFTRPLESAADALISGKTIWSRADMHDLKPVWFERLHSRDEILALGSSRLVQVPPAWFQPRAMLNGALAGGDFEDAVAMFRLCLETGKTPQLVLLELNPTLTFEAKSRVAPALAPYFRRALLDYGIFPPTFFSGLLTLDGFRWDPKYLLPYRAWSIAEEQGPGAYRMYPWGNADSGFLEPGPAPDEVERTVVAGMHSLDPQYRHWRTASRPGWFDLRILRAFLDDLQSRGIRVAVLLVPVHPAAFDFYSRAGGYDESWIRREMAARGIQVIGSYSPSAAQATRADFFDDVHVHLSLLHRLLREGGIVP
jgi:hypothetical protein